MVTGTVKVLVPAAPGISMTGGGVFIKAIMVVGFPIKRLFP